jgi:hypothetical protein
MHRKSCQDVFRPFQNIRDNLQVHLTRLHTSNVVNVPQFKAAFVNGNFNAFNLKLQENGQKIKATNFLKAATDRPETSI